VNPKHPKLEVPLEMYGPGAPRLLEWKSLEGSMRGVGLLRYDAGARADRSDGRSQYVAIIDLLKNKVVAIEPHSWGTDKASWKWTQAAVVVTDPDGIASTVQLRRAPPAVMGFKKVVKVRVPRRRTTVHRKMRKKTRRKTRSGAAYFREEFGN